MNPNNDRYKRQTVLPEVGQDGQEKLKMARILCVGAGGLGSPALLYLAAAGVGTIGIVDGDQVDLGNLQRQILFSEDQIGENKALAAVHKLAALNSDNQYLAYPDRLTAQNALELFKQYDLIIDASDNFDTKFLINDAALKSEKPFMMASILGFEAQMGLFNATTDAPCYRCLFTEKPTQNTPNCAEAGIIGALAGMVGSAQALEVVKWIVKDPSFEGVDGMIWRFNAKNFGNYLTRLPKDLKCSSCSKPANEIDLDMHLSANLQSHEITHEQACEMLSANAQAKLIDVREQDEWDAGRIDDADHLPLSLLLEGHRPDNLSKEEPVILYCLKGMRSLQALQILKAQGYSNLYSVKGGYEQWQTKKIA